MLVALASNKSRQRIWAGTGILTRLEEMLPTTKIMKNYPRCFPVTEEMTQTWTGCSYIGETTRTHDQILELGEYKLDYSVLNHDMC